MLNSLRAQIAPRPRRESLVSSLPVVGIGNIGQASNPKMLLTGGSNTSISTNPASSNKPLPNCRVEPDGSLTINNLIDFGEEVMCCRFSPNGALIAVGLNNGLIKIFNTEMGENVHNLCDNETSTTHLPVTNMRFTATKKKASSSKTLVAAYASGIIKIWLYSLGKCLQTIYENQQVLCVSFNPDLTRLASGGSESIVNIYNTATMQVVNTCQAGNRPDIMDGHRMRIFAVQYHPEDGNQLISAGWDGTVQFWDDRQPHSIRRLSGVHICGDGLDIDPLTQNILTASWRNAQALQIWNYKSCEKVKDIPADTNPCLYYCSQWVGKNYIIAGGCEHNMLRVISRVDGNTICRIVNLPTGVKCVDHYRSGKIKIAFGSSTFLYMLDVCTPS